MPARKRGIGANDFFENRSGSQRTVHHYQMAEDAEVARAAKLAGHKSSLQRLHSRVGRSNGEAECAH